MRILFMGSSTFAVPALVALVRGSNKIVGVVTQPDKPKGRGLEIVPTPVKEVANELGLAVFQPSQAKKETFIKTVEELDLGLIVLAAFGQILPKEILDLPKYGCINIHPSLLPKYRGPAPIQWSIINGDVETGVSVIFLNERLDAGDIIMQKKVDVEEEDDNDTLSARLAVIGAKLLEETIGRIESGNITRIPQNEEEASYAPSLSKEDGLIDWTLPAKRIHNFVRGLMPWPGTYTYLGDMPIKICETVIYAEESSDDVYRRRPGKILAKIKKEGWLVKTGHGKVVVRKIQLPGKRVMTVDEFCSGHNVEIGTVLKGRGIRIL